LNWASQVKNQTIAHMNLLQTNMKAASSLPRLRPQHRCPNCQSRSILELEFKGQGAAVLQTLCPRMQCQMQTQPEPKQLYGRDLHAALQQVQGSADMRGCHARDCYLPALFANGRVEFETLPPMTLEMYWCTRFSALELPKLIMLGLGLVPAFVEEATAFDLGVVPVVVCLDRKQELRRPEARALGALRRVVLYSAWHGRLRHAVYGRPIEQLDFRLVPTSVSALVCGCSASDLCKLGAATSAVAAQRLVVSLLMEHWGLPRDMARHIADYVVWPLYR